MEQTTSPGTHLLIDLWGAAQLDDAALIEQALREAACACGATLLDVRLHSFGESAGVTGVALLAESHISIHTWPESGFAALDVFMCGICDPRLALPVLRKHFRPQREQVSVMIRGNTESANTEKLPR